jgi:hypothetical protein
MPMIGSPLVASRPASVRPARLPEAVKAAITSMVEQGLDFVAAGQQHGVTAQMMRRWLGRGEAIAFLRKERARFRATVCAANDAYLVGIRSGDNSMAAVRAIQVLEGLADAEMAKPANAVSPGVTIRIVHQTQPAPIDVTPSRIIDAGEE